MTMFWNIGAAIDAGVTLLLPMVRSDWGSRPMWAWKNCGSGIVLKHVVDVAVLWKNKL